MKKGAYGFVYQKVMRNLNLAGNAKLIYAYLASFAGNSETCYPSIETICKELGMTKTTMYKYMNMLIDCGVVEKKQTYVGNIKGRVIYRITHEIVQDAGIPKISEIEESICSDSEKIGSRDDRKSTVSETNINNTNINIIKNNKKSRENFTPPTLEEVKSYCMERNNGVDPERFIDFYTCKGWMVGKTKMKDWKAAVRTWERRDNSSAANSYTRSNRTTEDEQKRINRERYNAECKKYGLDQPIPGGDDIWG